MCKETTVWYGITGMKVSQVTIQLLAALLPIVGLGAFIWWAGRGIVQGTKCLLDVRYSSNHELQQVSHLMIKRCLYLAEISDSNIRGGATAAVMIIILSSASSSVMKAITTGIYIPSTSLANASKRNLTKHEDSMDAANIIHEQVLRAACCMS